jgi:phosphoribosylformylglycinamidine cyclo-ligase
LENVPVLIVVTVEIYVPEVAKILPFQNHSMSIQIVGRVEAADGKKLTISSEYGTFEY